MAAGPISARTHRLKMCRKRAVLLFLLAVDSSRWMTKNCRFDELEVKSGGA